MFPIDGFLMNRDNVATCGDRFHKGYIMPFRVIVKERVPIVVDCPHCFVIIIVHGGSGVIQLNGIRYSFISPALFCLNETEKVKIDGEFSGKIECVYFNPEVVNEALNIPNIRMQNDSLNITQLQDVYLLSIFIERDTNKIGYLAMGPQSESHIRSLSALIHNELTCQRDEFWPCRSRSYLIELLIFISSLKEDGVCSQKGSRAVIDSDVMRIIQYINRHYTRNILIAELTSHFQIDRTTMSEKFVKETGLSVIRYVNKVRIDTACILLRETELRIIEIMYRVGFNDPAHFGRTFKRCTGFTPSAYRTAN